MQLTGKCLASFIRYFKETYCYLGKNEEVDKELAKFDFENKYHGHFELSPSPMKYGVIVDFFDQCNVDGVEDTVFLENGYIAGGHTRQEARIFAVEKNCKRYNQNYAG